MIIFLQNWGTLIIAVISLSLSVISLVKSCKAQNVQIKVNELEVKIKEYELNRIQQEEKNKNKTIVEANVVQVSKNNYRIKVCNLSEKSVYNVIAEIETEGYSIINDGVMPFEVLEPKKSFEIPLIKFSSSPRKFKIVTKWQDEENKEYKNKQIRSL